MQNRKDMPSSSKQEKPYYKLIGLTDKTYNPELRLVFAGRRGPLPAVVQDGSVFVQASRDTLIGLTDQGISCIYGTGYVEREFVFTPSLEHRKQYLLQENATEVQLLPKIAGTKYEDAEAARARRDISFFDPFAESIVEYFKAGGKRVHAEYWDIRSDPDQKKKYPIIFNIYEYAPGSMLMILPITRAMGASRICLRRDNDGSAKFWFEPAFPLAMVNFPT